VEIKDLVEPFDDAGLVYPWKHHDPRVDALGARVHEIVRANERMKRSRAATFGRISEAAAEAAGDSAQLREQFAAQPVLVARAAIPYLNEPWYC
jgi:hypothetical protein